MKKNRKRAKNTLRNIVSQLGRLGLCLGATACLGGTLLGQDRLTYTPSIPADNLPININSMSDSAGIQLGLGDETFVDAISAYPDSIPQGYPTSTTIAQPMHFDQPMIDTGHVGYGAVMPADCHMGCDRAYYVTAEALWIKRSGDEGFSLSRGSVLEPFGFELGGRFTVGQMFDCLDGVEATYTGPLDWFRGQTVNAGAGGPLVSQLTTDGYLPADIDTFNDASVHQQLWRAQYQSFEFNRRWWAWDILSTMVGVRGIDYEEDYAFNAIATNGGLGFHRVSVDNFLIGLQAGADAYYPISQRLSIGARNRLGVFANFNEERTFLSNRGVTRLNAGDKDVDIAGLIESGVVARYRILPKVVATAGYEIWYLAGVATVPEQRVTPVSPLTGTRSRASDEVLFHGATAGVEISF